MTVSIFFSTFLVAISPSLTSKARHATADQFTSSFTASICFLRLGGIVIVVRRKRCFRIEHLCIQARMSIYIIGISNAYRQEGNRLFLIVLRHPTKGVTHSGSL